MTNTNKDKKNYIFQELLNKSDFETYLAFSRHAGVKELTLHRIDAGLLNQISLGELEKIALGLNMSLDNLVRVLRNDSSESVALEKESTGDRQKDLVFQEFQQSVLDVLESLLLQLPTIVKAVEDYPSLPAVRLIPLLKPLDSLLSAWGISAIAPVGSIVPYNPQEHQLMSEETSSENIENVEIRYTGYRQNGQLLYRAKVSPVSLQDG